MRRVKRWLQLATTSHCSEQIRTWTGVRGASNLVAGAAAAQPDGNTWATKLLLAVSARTVTPVARAMDAKTARRGPRRERKEYTDRPDLLQ